jgi:nickel superoxide dismutase
MKIRNIIAIAIIIAAFGFNNVHAHCQVPCGIYDDAVRIIQIREHVTTIEKAMKQIEQLASDKSSAQNMNQLIRWINTKEEHATFIQSTMANYYLAQRIKPKKKGFNDKTLLISKKKLFSKKDVKNLRIAMIQYSHDIYFFLQSPKGFLLVQDEELKTTFERSQRKAKIEKRGLWSENIFKDCIKELYNK